MANIRRISKLQHLGTLRSFAWPSTLLDFARYNLIYGWNGSGKTTISRIFRSLEQRQQPSDCREVTLLTDAESLDASAFSEATFPVRVFNRDFIHESVFPTGGGDIPLILVLGKANVEKQKRLDRLKVSVDEATRAVQAAIDKRRAANKSFEDYCAARAKSIKETLRSSGPSPYNSYNRSHFKQRTQRMLQADNATASRLDPASRQARHREHQATPKDKISHLTCSLPHLPTHAQDVSQLLARSVTSTVIEYLKDDRKVASWVHQGLELHKSENAKRCLFCDQVFPQERLNELSAHFNDDYNQILGDIDGKLLKIRGVLVDLQGLQLPHEATFYESLTEEYTATTSKLASEIEVADDFLVALEQQLAKKKGRLFESYSLKASAPSIRSSIVDEINSIIDKHNDMCDGFKKRVDQARESLEADLVAASLEEFGQLDREVATSKSAVIRTTEELRTLQVEINDLEKEITEHRRPAEELNQDLRNYLGHDDLQLVVKDTGYEITRRGTLAKQISEGETTAIALLYFLKSLQSQEFDLSKGVVVLDDPVSSLDANALFLAFGYIQERTRNSAQLFIFTHNFTFFRQVRSWFQHIKGQNKRNVSQRPARFYMLDWRFDKGQRTSTLGQLDPLLEQYESDYHYLFARLYREAQNIARTGLEENYILPNMARRLLEMFLAFHRPQMSGDLWNKLRSIEFDEPRKTRIWRFVNTHSHSNSVGEPEHDPSLLAEARPVLGDIMELMRSQHAEHFNAMKELVESVPEEGDQPTPS